MARFILDVNTDEIYQVLSIVERDGFLSDKVSTLICIDTTNENQFHEDYLKNQLSEKQINSFNNELVKSEFGYIIPFACDVKGNYLNKGDEVVLINIDDLDNENIKRGQIFEVKGVIDVESNFIDLGEISLYGFRVLKINL